MLRPACLILALLGVGAAPAGAGEPAEVAAAEIARPAHDIVYEDINPASPTHGQRLSLSEQWNGSGVVINFLASWCGYCWKELPELEKLHAAGEARIVGIAADEYGAPIEILLSLVNRAGLTIPILFVPEEDTAKLEQHYAHQMLPATYVIDREGAIRRVLEGAVPPEVLRKEILGRLPGSR